MSKTVISARNLGKRYRIGRKQEQYSRFSESVMNLLKNPIRRLREIGRPIPEDELFWALRDVNFDIQKGESVGILGSNGAGKSTLLKVLSRITEMTEGEVSISGRVGSLLEVGTGFHPELTGRENVYLNGTILGMTRQEIDRKFDEIVDFAEVEQFLDTPVKRYSSGMMIRLAFAVAAHLETEILIVDEVLAVGDTAFQKKCLGKMNDVANEGRTVLFVSHNLASIATLCDRAILLKQGHIVMDSDVKSVISHYLSSKEVSDGLVPTDYPRPVETGEAYLRKIDIQDMNGYSRRDFQLNEPMKFVLTYEVFKPIEFAVVELGLTTFLGERFSTSFNINHNQPAVTLEPSMVELCVEMSPNLLPGRFGIDVFMHHRDDVTIDWVEQVLQFSVSDTSAIDDETYVIQRRISNPIRGYVRPYNTIWHTPKKLS